MDISTMSPIMPNVTRKDFWRRTTEAIQMVNHKEFNNLARVRTYLGLAKLTQLIEFDVSIPNCIHLGYRPLTAVAPSNLFC